MTELDDSAPAALDRMLALTGRSRRAASFLLAWCNAERCGGFDLTDLWTVDGPVVADMLVVVQLIARLHDDPTVYGCGAAFERLVDLW